jgi:aminopeptidase N
MSSDTDKKFEFPGSSIHFLPRLKFTITHMFLKISPNFKTKELLNCQQKLKVKALQNIKEIVLDVAELKINNISSDDVQLEKYPDNEISSESDKLLIRFKTIIKEKTEFELSIDYSCGYCFGEKKDEFYFKSPRSGFHFIVQDPMIDSSSAFQSWTQGETTESKYWFPCIDDPQVKFTREIHVTAPNDGYYVISNGNYTRKGNVWIWIESTPNPSYLTSVVIGKFNRQVGSYGKVSLQYYWPTNISKNYDPMLTFGETPQIIKFFEEYIKTTYPYKKYWQIAVDKFEFGGMENTNCTTLTCDILHDRRASLDYSRDIIIIAHELAHQWFGDLITCKDWSHIWLNEGFASYFEILYWRHKFVNKSDNTKAKDEFLYKIIQTIKDYLDEAHNLYKRPIVTSFYKHPDELFDSHSYEKGGLVLYMLSNLMGEDKFQNMIKKYLDTYRESSITTEDFRKVCEDIYGEDLQEFFNQWLYTSGHPELEIQFSVIEEKNQKGKQTTRIKIKITQTQKEDFDFHFPLEIRMVCSDKKNKNKIVMDTIEKIIICKRETEYTFQKDFFRNTTMINWISIDPNLKILKEIKSFTVVNQDDIFNLDNILNNQLESDIATISEKIESLHLMRDCYSKKTVDLLTKIILTDPFYGVSVEAANVLGSYHDKKNYIKDNDAYEALQKCIVDDNFSKLDPHRKRAIIMNLGLFERESTLELKAKKNKTPMLVNLLDDKSYFVENTAATAIGKSVKNLPNGGLLKERMVNLLIDKVVNSETFQDQLAQGAILGLRELANDQDIDLVKDIADLLIRKSGNIDPKLKNSVNRYFIRSAATLALGKFLVTKNDQVKKDKIKKEKIDLINESVLDHLLNLLKDERRRVKINASIALADKDAKVTELNERITKSIKALKIVAEEDVDGFVRRNAEINLNLIREWLKEWTNKPPVLEIKVRKEPTSIQNKIKNKKDIEKNKDKIKENEEMLENEKEYENRQRAASKQRLEY